MLSEGGGGESSQAGPGIDDKVIRESGGEGGGEGGVYAAAEMISGDCEFGGFFGDDNGSTVMVEVVGSEFEVVVGE